MLLGLGFIIVGVALVSMGGWVHRIGGMLAIALALFSFCSLAVRRRPTAQDPPDQARTPAPFSATPQAPLDESERRRVQAHLTDLVRVGALAPDETDLAWVCERLAQEGDGGDPDTVLMVLSETSLQRMTFLDNQIEQFPETVREQIAELARIADAAVQVHHVRVTATRPREVRIQAHLTVDGQQVSLDYPSPAKNLTLDLPVGLARAFRSTGGLRLAGLDSGDGALTVVALAPDTDLAPLDQHLLADDGWRGADDVWFWLDEADPF